jgi:crotonobetainyl-CoA:carnitine CoA-transferase CaiB-like acyl-CoA transferase
MTGIVPKFSRTPGRVAATGPKLGEHTRAVLADLADISTQECQALCRAGLAAEPERLAPEPERPEQPDGRG